MEQKDIGLHEPNDSFMVALVNSDENISIKHTKWLIYETLHELSRENKHVSERSP